MESLERLILTTFVLTMIAASVDMVVGALRALARRRHVEHEIAELEALLRLQGSLVGPAPLAGLQEDWPVVRDRVV